MLDLRIVEENIKKADLNFLIIKINEKQINDPINEYGQTLIHLFSYLKNHILVNLLLSLKADITKLDMYGHSALHYAAMSGAVENAKILIDNSHAINAVNYNGDTPLHYACLYNHKDFVDFMIDKNVNKQIVNNDGLSALHYAIALDKKDTAASLLEKGIKITEFADNGYSVLHVSSAVGNPVMTKGLIEYKNGKDLVNLKDQALNWTPLHFAKLARNKNIIELLKKNGAIDSPPTLSFEKAKLIVDNIRTTMCQPEKMVEKVTDGTSTLTGAGLTYGMSKLIGFDQLMFITQLAAKGTLWAVNSFLIKYTVKEWLSLPIAESDAYNSFRDNYCKDVIDEKIISPNQVTSLRHAEKFLSFNEIDYIALGSKCNQEDALPLTTFNEFGLDWSLCSGIVQSDIHAHIEL